MQLLREGGAKRYRREQDREDEERLSGDAGRLESLRRRPRGPPVETHQGITGKHSSIVSLRTSASRDPDLERKNDGTKRADADPVSPPQRRGFYTALSVNSLWPDRGIIGSNDFAACDRRELLQRGDSDAFAQLGDGILTLSGDVMAMVGKAGTMSLGEWRGRTVIIGTLKIAGCILVLSVLAGRYLAQRPEIVAGLAQADRDRIAALAGGAAMNGRADPAFTGSLRGAAGQTRLDPCALAK